MLTPSPTRRRGPKPNTSTRHHLVAKGAEAFHAAGYAACGVQEIVAAAGVPKGSFYNHFDSKESFGAAVIETWSERSLARLRQVMEDEGVPPRERLVADFSRRVKAYQEAGYRRGCLFGNLTLEVADHSDIMRQGLTRHFHQWRDLVAACIAAAQEDGTIRNATTASALADFTLNAWEGALLRARAEKSSDALTVFQDVIFKQVLL